MVLDVIARRGKRVRDRDPPWIIRMEEGIQVRVCGF
jgi:hypothetical protein